MVLCQFGTGPFCTLILALYNGAMAMTATIRVPVETRDRLALVATKRGQSLSGYLTSLSREQFKAVIAESARQEALMDAANPSAREEYAVWEGTLDDGIE